MAHKDLHMVLRFVDHGGPILQPMEQLTRTACRELYVKAKAVPNIAGLSLSVHIDHNPYSVNKQEFLMAHKDLHMVLRFDAGNPEVFKSLTQLMRQTCKEVHAAATLIHGSINDGSPAPDITLYADDFFEGKNDIDIKLAEEAQEADAAVPPNEVAGG